VQSLANQTIARAETLDDFRPAFEGRLQALSRAHDLLVEEDWAGADLGQLARRTLDPYRDASNDRITVDGPRLIVDASSSTSLVLILHELATNAAKYGALSTSAGALDLKWRRDGGNLVLSGRNTVDAPSNRPRGRVSARASCRGSSHTSSRERRALTIAPRVCAVK
jgi:two-component system CheB/CheR fusion protein